MLDEQDCRCNYLCIHSCDKQDLQKICCNGWMLAFQISSQNAISEIRLRLTLSQLLRPWNAGCLCLIDLAPPHTCGLEHVFTAIHRGDLLPLRALPVVAFAGRHFLQRSSKQFCHEICYYFDSRATCHHYRQLALRPNAENWWLHHAVP